MASKTPTPKKAPKKGNNQKNQNISCVSNLDIKLSGSEMVILSMPINISSFFDNT